MVEDLLAEGEPVSLEAHLARLDAATGEQVHALARELFGDPRRGLVVLGPPDTPRLGDDDLGSVSS